MQIIELNSRETDEMEINEASESSANEESSGEEEDVDMVESASNEENSDDDDDIEELSDGDVENKSSENSDEENEESSEEDKTTGNAGWADAISKVLKTNKPKNKKTLVLSRAKKINDPRYLSDPKPEGPGFDIEGEIEEKEEKPKLPLPPSISSAKEKELKRKRKEWEKLCRVKPKVLDKDRERALAKIATRGVVQLFNAVRQQQKSIESNLKDVGSSERKQEKVLRSVDKNSFLDMLMGPTKSSVVSHNSKKQEDKKPSVKVEEEDTKAPLWSVLRDDFLVGGKLKDWDKTPAKGGNEEKESSFSEGSGSESD